MNMSKAALPQRYGQASAEDHKHPLFPIYRQYRASMTMLLVNSEDFRDWLHKYKQNEINLNFTRHKQYPNFMTWMKFNQGGSRKCPAGVFPHNFNYWLNGGRW
jgi:hypothetical protein